MNAMTLGLSGEGEQVRIGVDGKPDIIPDFFGKKIIKRRTGFFGIKIEEVEVLTHGQPDIEIEDKGPSVFGQLTARAKNAGAALRGFLPAKGSLMQRIDNVGSHLETLSTSAKATMKEIGAGLVEYGVGTAKGLGAAVSAVGKFLKPQPKPETIVSESLEGDELILENSKKLTLREKAHQASQSLKQHSEALSTMAVSVGIGVGSKFAVAAALGASSGIVVPMVAAAGLGTAVALAIRGRKNWRAAQIEQNKEAFYQETQKLGGLELKGETEEERKAEFFRSVKPQEYDDRAGRGFLRNIGSTLRDLTRKDVWKSITTRDVGYALGAGLTAGVASALTHLAHDAFWNGDKLSTNPVTDNTQSVSPKIVAPVVAPVPVVDFASVPLAQKLEMIRTSIQGDPSPYIENRLGAAAHGNAQAMKDVGRALLAGEHGLAVDKPRAIVLYEQAAAAGNEQAIRDLAYIKSLPEQPVAAVAPSSTADLQPVTAPSAKADFLPKADAGSAGGAINTPVKRPSFETTFGDLPPMSDKAPVVKLPLPPMRMDCGVDIGGIDPSSGRRTEVEFFNKNGNCDVMRSVGQNEYLYVKQGDAPGLRIPMRSGETVARTLGRLNLPSLRNYFSLWSTKGGAVLLPSEVPAGYNLRSVSGTGPSVVLPDAPNRTEVGNDPTSLTANDNIAVGAKGQLASFVTSLGMK